jgi:hypothetical protein
MRKMDWKYRRGPVGSLIVSCFQEILDPILYRQCRLWKMMERRKLPLLPEAPLQLPPTQGAEFLGTAFIVRIRVQIRFPVC